MTDKHIPASKLEALIDSATDAINLSFASELLVIKVDDLRALIDAEPKSVEPVAIVDKSIPSCEIQYTDAVGDDGLPDGTPLYTAPPADNLIAELIYALEDAKKKISKAKAFEYEAQAHISESSYELNGFLGSVAAEISVNWQKTIDRNDALIKRAKEYLK